VSTEQQWLVNVTVDGRDLGIYDSMSGGDVDVDSAKHRPGGMGPEKSYRSLPTYKDVTVSRVLERERDWEILRWLQDKAGGVRAQVSRQPLDEDGNAWGTPMTWAGRLGPVKGGDVDSTSSKPTMYEFDVFVETRS
jgi:hypothetical protein